MNDRRRFDAPRSTRLLAALESEGLHLPSACGGKGTCGQCRVTFQAPSPSPAVVPAESALLSPDEIAAGVRLACQQSLRDDVAVRIPEAIFGVSRFTCRVRSARFVGTMIREIIAELPPGEKLDFRAGGFVEGDRPALRSAIPGSAGGSRGARRVGSARSVALRGGDRHARVPRLLAGELPRRRSHRDAARPTGDAAGPRSTGHTGRRRLFVPLPARARKRARRLRSLRSLLRQ